MKTLHTIIVKKTHPALGKASQRAGFSPSAEAFHIAMHYARPGVRYATKETGSSFRFQAGASVNYLFGSFSTVKKTPHVSIVYGRLKT